VSTPLRLMPAIITLTMAIAPSCGVEDRTDLDVTAPRTDLRVGETVQLKVVHRLTGGSSRDLTGAQTGTVYHTTSESMLIPEPDGKVTCIGAGDRQQESAVVGVGNRAHHGHLRFRLFSAGPGPSLDVVAENSQLREGEKTQLHVFRRPGDGSRKEITATSDGTHYLTFAGTATMDRSVIDISAAGLASAANTIGKYNYRTVTVFVRNGDSVGWVRLTVVPAKATNAR